MKKGASVLELYFTKLELPDIADDIDAQHYFDNDDYCNEVKLIGRGQNDLFDNKLYLSIEFDRMWDYNKFFPFLDKCFSGIVALEVICHNYISQNNNEITFQGIPSSIKYIRWIYGPNTRMSFQGLHDIRWLDYACYTNDLNWTNYCRRGINHPP